MIFKNPNPVMTEKDMDKSVRIHWSKSEKPVNWIIFIDIVILYWKF